MLKDAIDSSDAANLMMQLKYYVGLPDPKTHVYHVLQEVCLRLLRENLSRACLACFFLGLVVIVYRFYFYKDLVTRK